jgi:hypothetical protein
MSATEKTSLTEIIIEGLKATATELEEFRLQMALGKADAKDLFEDTKGRLRVFVQEAKSKYHSMKDAEVLKVINAIELLEVKLALGLAETKETFEKQRKEIIRALSKLDAESRAHEPVNELKAIMHLEIEKFRMKLALLTLHYKLKKLTVEFNFEQKKQELADKLQGLRDNMLSAESKAQWKHFKKQMGQAYLHFKQAFGS